MLTLLDEVQMYRAYVHELCRAILRDKRVEWKILSRLYYEKL